MFLTESHGRQFAVKLLRTTSNQQSEQDFLDEAKVLVLLSHPRIVPLDGCCLEKKPWLLLFPYYPYRDICYVLNTLKFNRSYLRAHELLTIAEQVAEGLSFLADKRYLHRDIAARNILLDRNNIVRIADFGLARPLPPGQDEWKLDKLGRLPVKYMAVETLTKKVFSLASEVWSYGVYLWEVLSYGDNPWEKENIALTDMRTAVAQGRRLSRPERFAVDTALDDPDAFEQFDNVHQAIYDIATQCWAATPSSRPSIHTVRTALSNMLLNELRTLPPLRDIGLLCVDAAEAIRRRRKSHK